MIKILKLLNPQPPIAGLEISDLSLRYFIVKAGQPKIYSVKLEPGVVVEGKLQNKEAFLKALLNLRAQITKKTKQKLFVILNISASNVYSQIFDLPKVAEDNLEEAVQLNLQMISPINISEAYYDCQKVGESKEKNKIEIAGAFIYRNIIDDFSEMFLKANFVIVAVEFVPLAITRLVKELALNFDKQASYILFHISSDGLNFLIIRNDNLYFNYFTSWRSLKGEKRYISPEEFRTVVIDETKKILSFYNRNWADPIRSFLIFAQGLSAEIKEITTKDLSLEVQEVAFKKFSKLEYVWFPVLGSSLRGLIDRSEDNIISLASTGTEEEFKRQLFITFVHLWQKIVFSFLAFIIATISAADIFLFARVNMLQQNKALITTYNQEELNRLQTQAKEFNKNLVLLKKARSEAPSWSSLFLKIKTIAAQDNIEILKLVIESDQKTIGINARATDEKKAAGFKQRLINEVQFKEVSMPLSNIQPVSENLINFYISFKLN
ncbi:hypothetical protein COS59_00730 [Candidatus Wolfebacteria bacterium CG03_land_8_20_14_0_80_36_15]|uniref:SHS2 domain-containing protein n=1 Tax=Candidatus Wolfebacteria bacterium CG03_land_8_20_14_0_80_36_15 TaxID=1975067 RepID=A0A2M7B831_9BACT|nr:MAG: hypothetical protein COS59_00730 [Candidatus Wolfebacteria bacterium CG03_land_8_20_14_0_80_36_15]